MFCFTFQLKVFAQPWRFIVFSVLFLLFFQNTVKMPVDRDSETYNMNHRRRGYALIFNHKNFDPRLGLKTRNGTDADRQGDIK